MRYDLYRNTIQSMKRYLYKIVIFSTKKERWRIIIHIVNIIFSYLWMNLLIDQISNVYLFNLFILLLALICAEFSIRFHKLDMKVLKIQEEAMDELFKLENNKNNCDGNTGL